MNDAPVQSVAGRPSSRDFRRLVALIVDDSTSRRELLRLLLGRWNFEVLEAPDGATALELCRRHEIDFVISDWMMPGMTGPSLCRALRAMPLSHYPYIILLTAKSDREAVAIGLEAGADDFLSKPPDAGELHARLRAGQRILAMQEDLADKNRRITEAFDRVNQLYEGIGRDLRAAARLQRALIPPRQSRLGPVGIGTLWRPAGPNGDAIGGDLVGFARVSDSRVGAWSVDVSGHGVPSALMTARLAHLFAAANPDECPAIRRLPNGAHAPRDPADLAADLNARLQDGSDPDEYFTMLFADIDIGTGLVRFCQAGHPPPAILRRGGVVEFVGQGGAPVGLIPDMVWETETMQLEPGERLVLLSDGITGCEGRCGETFEAARLSGVLSRTSGLPEADQLDELLGAMADFAGTASFADDVSAIVVTMP